MALAGETAQDGMQYVLVTEHGAATDSCVGAVEALPDLYTIITSYPFSVHARSISVLPSAVAVAAEGLDRMIALPVAGEVVR